jgi:death on curing protein
MRYFTSEQILFVHTRQIAETGGSHGVRDLARLESAVARPQATFDDKELYPDLFLKAAELLDSLINNHPFVDGNKRTGITAVALFLRANGRQMTPGTAELEEFTMQVATSPRDLPILNEMFFTTSISTNVNQSQVSWEYTCFLEEATLPDIHFYDLRHTSISYLRDISTPINTV